MAHEPIADVASGFMWCTPTSDGRRAHLHQRPARRHRPSRLLNIKSPARMWIGGWYNNYDFVGDIDEVRISKVARSADWVRLEYENQKPLQTLAGPVVQPGNDVFRFDRRRVTVLEGKTPRFGQGGGAPEGLLDSQERWPGNSRRHRSFTFTFDAGRVTGDQSATLQFKAIYAEGGQDAGQSHHDQGGDSGAGFSRWRRRRTGTGGRRSRSSRRSPIWPRCKPKARRVALRLDRCGIAVIKEDRTRQTHPHAPRTAAR